MRRMLTVLALATLVVGSAAPVGASDKAQSGDEPITAMGKRGGRHGGHHDGRRGYHGGRHRRGHHGHDGYRRGHRHHHDRGYHRHRHHRYGYGYDRGYYGGYYGCGYYPDCDPYYGGYYGGRRYYYDRYNYDRYDYCSRGPRYDSRCDCYHRDTRCDRNYRGRGYYGPYSVDGPEMTSTVPDAPAAESPSPQEQSNVVAYDHEAGPVPDEPSSEPAPAPEPSSEPAPAPEPSSGQAEAAPAPASDQPAPAPSSEPAPEPAPAPAEEQGSPDKTVAPANTNPDPNAEPGTGKAKYDRESSDTGEELF